MCPDAIALLLPASTVPFDPKRLSFYAADNLSRPDAVGAFWAALRETCRATGELKPFWLSEFVVYTAMGIKYIKKCVADAAVEGSLTSKVASSD